MAKVYDALKRAEQERKLLRADPSPSVAPFFWAPPQSAPPTERPPFWRRWGWGARRRLRGVAATADESNKRRYSLLQPDSYVAEQFRGLRGRIDAMASKVPIRTIAVTSARPGEGKTTAAVNIATVTALSVGRRVLLIDCDLRKPTVARTLGLKPEAGLMEVLTDATHLDAAIVKVEDLNLDVLAVRRKARNPSELLGSARMRELVDEVVRRYDRVILDTPAALDLPDAKAVSELCDGIIMVVRADVTPQRDVDTVLEILDRGRVLGFVLNGAEIDRERYEYTA